MDNTVQGVCVAEKSKWVRILAIIEIVLGGGVLGIGCIAGGVLLLTVPNFPQLGISVALIVCGVLFMGLFLGIYIPQLVILEGLPRELILLEGTTYSFWCGKNMGYVRLSTDQIRTVSPASGIWTSNWIMLISGHYDAALTVTDFAGRSYKVSFVRDVKTVANNIQAFCAQVNVARAQSASLPPQEGPASSAQ